MSVKEGAIVQVIEGVIGRRYVIENINLEQALERRLEMLGMTKGTKILILNKKAGSVILKVRGTRFAVGEEIARGILMGEMNHA